MLQIVFIECVLYSTTLQVPTTLVKRNVCLYVECFWLCAWMCAWCGGGGLTCLSTYAHVNGENRTQDPSLSHCFIYSQKKKTGHKIPLSHTRTHGFIYSQLNDFKNGLRRTLILFSRLSHQGRAACIFFFLFRGDFWDSFCNSRDIFAAFAGFLTAICHQLL